MQAVFVAFGIEYLAMAVNAGRTLRTASPGVGTVVVTNVPAYRAFLEAEFDSVVVVDEPDTANRLAKLRADEFVTSDVAVYLDADIEVTGDIRPVFSLLDRHDVLLHAFRVPTKFRFAITDHLEGSMMAQFWGAVIFFRRNARSRALFAAWTDRFEQSGIRRDQPALQRAVLDLPDVRVLPLNMVWGSTDDEVGRHADLAREPARIRHYGAPESDPDVLRRVAAAHDAVVAALPVPVRSSVEVRSSVLRYARLRRLTTIPRPLHGLARTLWRLQDLRHGTVAPPRGKQDAAGGRDHLGGVTLWDDVAGPSGRDD